MENFQGNRPLCFTFGSPILRLLPDSEDPNWATVTPGHEDGSKANTEHLGEADDDPQVELRIAPRLIQKRQELAYAFLTDGPPMAVNFDNPIANTDIRERTEQTGVPVVLKAALFIFAAIVAVAFLTIDQSATSAIAAIGSAGFAVVAALTLWDRTTGRINR